jgi:hypothetical protein
MQYTNLEEIEEQKLVSGFNVRFIQSERITDSWRDQTLFSYLRCRGVFLLNP